MYNPQVKDTSGLAEGCYSYRDIQKDVNPRRNFRSGLPKYYFLTPHMIYDMVALDQSQGQSSRFQLMRRIGSVWPFMIRATTGHSNRDRDPRCRIDENYIILGLSQ